MNTQTAIGPAASSNGMSDWLGASDHKRVSILQLVAVLTALLLGATFGLFLHIDHLAPLKSILGADVFAQMSSLHGVLMLVFCAAPALGIVFGNLLLPAMLGSSELAMPQMTRRGMQLQWWAVLSMVAAVLVGAVDGGWALLPPLSTSVGIPILLVSLALHLMALSLMAAGINQLATIFGAEVEGDVPLLARLFGVSALVQIVGAVVLGACGVLLFVEGTGRAQLYAEASALIDYARLWSLFTRAAMMMVVVPAVGLIFEIVAHAGRKQPHSPGQTTLAMGLTAACVIFGNSVFMGWQSGSVALEAAGSALALLALVPASAVAFNLLMTMQGGAIAINIGLLYALSGATNLVLGGMAGLFLATPSVGTYLQGTSFSTGHIHYVFLGGGLSVLIAALYHWWPQIVGKSIDRMGAAWGLALMFAGTHLSIMPELIKGSQGTASRLPFVDVSVGVLSQFSAFGGIILVTGLVFVIVNLLKSIVGGSPVDADSDVVWRPDSQ